MKKIFINLPVADLNRAKQFFTGLGFEFNPKFTDDNAACMILNPEAFVMLLRTEFFKQFTKRPICDGTTHTETLLALSLDSPQAVDTFVDKALSTGGSKAMDPTDHGFMYTRSFYDPDGHHWEIFSMDPKAAADGPPAA